MALRPATAIAETSYGYGNCLSSFHHSDQKNNNMLAMASRLSFSDSLRTKQVMLPCPLQKQSIQRKQVTTAVIKRKKDYTLDSVIQRQKKLKLVMKIKNLLIKEPGMVMSLKRLGKYRRQLGLTGKRRIVTLLRKYPAVFEVFEEGIGAYYFRLTEEAENHVLEEQKIKVELESALVTKLRKMLMMSIDKTLLLSKIDHLKRDLGLPDDYRTNMVQKYPEYFKVIETEAGLALELTSWDPELAITAWERKLQEPSEDDRISDRPPRFVKLDLPKGYSLKRKDKEVLRRFQEVPFVSPYSDFSQLNPSTKEAEKHTCAVIHELLTLTVEKRTLIDHLTHFRKDFKFPQKTYGLIIRHPELFYVSLKGDRDSVFLREAYDGAKLIHKDPLVLVKEKLGRLVALGKEKLNNEDSDEEEEDDGDDGWSDDEVVDDVLTESDDDDDNEEEEEELPKRREPRRPLNIVRKEQAIAALASAPRERW